jgi:hypothetical protein
MSYTYLQDQGEVSSAGCFSDISQFAPLNGMKMQEINLSNDKKMDASQDSQYGMMCQHLTENLGTELQILCAEGSLVKTYPPQAKEKGLRENGLDFGQKWPESLAKWSQDSFLWKTRQLSLTTDLEPYSENFPRWGIMQDGEFWELTIQDYHTTAIGAGLLPTVVKNEGAAFLGGPLRSTETWKDTSRLSHRLIGFWKNFKNREMNARIKQKIACHPIFAEWMMGWPEMWSASQELETDKFQAWLRLHSEPYQEYEES